MRSAAIGLLLTLVLWALGLASAPAQAGVIKVSSCFEPLTANLRLAQLEHAIDLCNKILDSRTTPRETRGEALAQRGILHARRWSIIQSQPDALQAIADITEGLRLHAPPDERRHHLLIVRAQLYVATGQLRRASDDYRAVISGDPDNLAAREGLRRIGQPETN